jgi:hypothetical protein
VSLFVVHQLALVNMGLNQLSVAELLRVKLKPLVEPLPDIASVMASCGSESFLTNRLLKNH